MYQIARYTDENIGGTGLMWDILANETHQVKKVLIASSRSIYGEGTYLCTANCGQVVPHPYTGIISIFSNQMRQNIPIDIYEDGQETRDFIFVEDVADICARALSLECETLLLNVGSGIATPVIDLAQDLKHLWQSNSDINITGNFRVGDIRHNWADLTALHQVFPDWQPTSLAPGLESFVTWAKTQEIYEDRSKAATQELKQRNL